jgi:hypothetical protein
MVLRIYNAVGSVYPTKLFELAVFYAEVDFCECGFEFIAGPASVMIFVTIFRPKLVL